MKRYSCPDCTMIDGEYTQNFDLCGSCERTKKNWDIPNWEYQKDCTIYTNKRPSVCEACPNKNRPFCVCDAPYFSQPIVTC